MKMQPMEWEKIFVNSVPDQDFMSKMHWSIFLKIQLSQ